MESKEIKSTKNRTVYISVVIGFSLLVITYLCSYSVEICLFNLIAMIVVVFKLKLEEKAYIAFIQCKQLECGKTNEVVNCVSN